MSEKKISVEEVKHFAELSRIKITDEEAEKFSKQFDDIVPFIAQISEIKTDGNISRDFQNLNTFREDVAKEEKNREAILEEMPETKDDYLVVKKILNN